MGHRPHYRASLGTTIRNDVSHSLPSLLQEDHRRHSTLHVDKCFGMGRLVCSRFASSTWDFDVEHRRNQDSRSCSATFVVQNICIVALFFCHRDGHVIYLMHLPHMSCGKQSAYHVGCCMDASMFHRGNATIVGVFATWMTTAMVLGHHRILCGRVPQQKLSTGCWEGPQIVVIGTVM